MSIIEYPDELLRGVSINNEQFITPEGYPTQAAFRFDDDNPERDDDFCELSINWVDDEGAIEILLDQINEKKNLPQFQGGYCRFPRVCLHMMKAYFDNGHITYERRPVQTVTSKGVVENKYHGNILMKKNLSKQTITNIQVTLAGLAGAVIPRKEF